MDWIQFATFVIANLVFTLTLWLWNRTESNADRRTAHEDRKDILNLIRAIEYEMKDFHGRLCAIEERRKEK